MNNFRKLIYSRTLITRTPINQRFKPLSTSFYKSYDLTVDHFSMLNKEIESKTLKLLKKFKTEIILKKIYDSHIYGRSDAFRHRHMNTRPET